MAISAFPLDARIGTETQANECSNTAVSGELMSDRGALFVLYHGRKADVIQSQILAGNVHSEGHVAVVYFVSRLHQLSHQRICEKEPTARRERGAVRLFLENGTSIGHTNDSATRAYTRRSTVCHEPCSSGETMRLSTINTFLALSPFSLGSRRHER